MQAAETKKLSCGFESFMRARPTVTMQWHYTATESASAHVIAVTKNINDICKKPVEPQGPYVQCLAMHYTMLQFRQDKLAARRLAIEKCEDSWPDPLLMHPYELEYRGILLDSAIGQEAEVYLKTGNGDLFLSVCPLLVHLNSLEQNYLFALAAMLLSSEEFDSLRSLTNITPSNITWAFKDSLCEEESGYEEWTESLSRTREITIQDLICELVKNPPEYSSATQFLYVPS